MQKIKEMDPKEIANRQEVKALWDKSLLWTVAHRRGARHPLGANIPKEDEGCWMPFESKNEPVPLTEVELALLCWVGAGTSGIIWNDVLHVPYVCTPSTFEGRVFPSGHNFWYDYLLFFNDDGVFLYTPHVPTKMVEIDTQEDMEIIFRAFKEGVTQISDQPIRIPPDAPWSMAARNQLLKPGTTNFVPMADMATSFINSLLTSNSRPLTERRGRILDDEVGEIPALQKWVDNGYLKGTHGTPLTALELGASTSKYHSHAAMMQNIQLCAAAMGLGNFLYAAVNRSMLMKELGFRFIKDKAGVSMAVGIDGVIESHHPPYMSVDEAVDDLWNIKFKPGYGRFNPDVKEGDEVMYPGFSTKPRAVHRPYKNVEAFFNAVSHSMFPEAVQIAKDTCNYFYDTYGRLTRSYDAMRFGSIVQIAHMEVDFYDQYYPQDAITKEARDHFNIWHK